MKAILRAAACVGLAGLVGAMVAPAPANACGGLVCNGGSPFNPVQVDQVNERIIFALEDDGAAGTLLTAVIQIQYTGSVDEFAWILPVPEVPENIDVASDAIFDDLEASTAPSFNFNVSFSDPSNGSFAPLGVGCSIFGCAASSGSSADSFGNGFGGPSPEGSGGMEGPVNVWGTGTAGPFELAIISADTVDPLLEWIYRHDFDAPEEFIEIADDYVKSNYKFVVVRLMNDADIDQIQPLVIQYHEEFPCVPLRMTSVAAIPDMGVRVWIVSDARAVPMNFRAVAPDYTKLAINGAATYEEFIASEIETAGGKGWVTEFAAPVGDAISNPNTFVTVSNPDTMALLGKGTYVTRLYTKISPWEMDEDPLFMMDATAGDVSNARTVTVTPVSSGVAFNAALWGDLALIAVMVGFALLRRRRAARSSAS